MHSYSPIEILGILSALAGALHVLAPDHWLPASILTWKNRWRWIQTLAFSGMILFLHVLLGFAIYLLVSRYTQNLDSERLFLFALALLALGTALRGIRFPRVKEVLGARPRSGWGILAVVSLLGPAESLIPILVKSEHLGMGYLIPFLAFLGGTLISGALLIALNGLVWDHPLLLTRGVRWIYRKRVALPVAALTAVGVVALLNIP